MGFFNICPRDKKYLNYSVGSIPLRVIRDNGIDMSPAVNIKVSNLNGDAKHFTNSSHKGGTFKIEVLIHRKDTLKGRYHHEYTAPSLKNIINKTGKSIKNNPYIVDLNKKIVIDYTKDLPITTVLDYIIRNMTPVLVTTSAIDIPNGTYIITSNSSRKQTYKDTTIWELEFTTYSALNLYKYKNNNSAILKAIKKMKGSGNSTNKKKLKKCNYKTLKYSKKKKTVKCVKYLQKILKSYKFYSGKIDGWFGKETVKAVKKFQKKKKLKKTGKINKKTFKALCK